MSETKVDARQRTSKSPRMPGGGSSDGGPAPVSSKVEVPLTYEEPADVAAVAVLRALLEVIELNLEGATGDLDPEFLHQLRVAVRRTRSLQRQLKRAFPPAELQRFRAEFRWVQAITGQARDLDVYLLGFDALSRTVDAELQGDLEPVADVLHAHRAAARQLMDSELRSKRFQRLRHDWAVFLERLPALPIEDRPAARRPIGALTGKRISKVYGQMVKMGDTIDIGSPPEQYHELRKKGKELRYLLQLLGQQLYPAEVVQPMVKSLKGLQDVLGHHQDCEVQMSTLRSVSEEVSARAGGSAGLTAIGALLGALAEDERAARAEFGERFAEFGAKRQRKLVKETFA